MNHAIKHITYGFTTVFFSMLAVFLVAAVFERPLFPVEQLEPSLQEVSP